MGANYKFTCPNCGESLFTSDGLDYGFVAVIQPMICDDCKELVEVLVGRRGEIGPTGDPEYDKKLNLCPSCGGAKLRPWPSNHPCLQCGTKMDKSDDPELLWD